MAAFQIKNPVEEEYIEMVKQAGQNIIDKAAVIVGDVKNCRQITIVIAVNPWEIPTMSYSKDYFVECRDE